MPEKTMSSLRLPVFPNWFPYNDMLLDGNLQIGKYGVKTRSYNWDYRGRVLLYNSGRTAWHCVNAYNYENSPEHHGVVIGVGELVDVRPLNDQEWLKMICNFNNITQRQVARNGFHRVFIEPLPFGYFFVNLRRFRKPVTFNWPAGPVRPILTKVKTGSFLSRQIRTAPNVEERLMRMIRESL